MKYKDASALVGFEAIIETREYRSTPGGNIGVPVHIFGVIFRADDVSLAIGPHGSVFYHLKYEDIISVNVRKGQSFNQAWPLT